MNAFGEYLYAAVGGMKVQVRLMPVTNNITANVAVSFIILIIFSFLPLLRLQQLRMESHCPFIWKTEQQRLTRME